MIKLTEEQIDALKKVVEHFNDEDSSVRQRQLRSWKRLKLLWENINNIYYSEVAHDWRTFPIEGGDSGDQEYYDKKVNVFRAYLESIFAALSVVVPPIKCYPDDAEDVLDLATAKAGDRIGQLVYRHNDAPLKWIHGLFVFGTEGMVAAHNYVDKDYKYGESKNNIYRDDTEIHELTKCPDCGFDLQDSLVTGEPDMMAQMPEMGSEMGMEQPLPLESLPLEMNDSQDEFMPGEDECPNCGSFITPVISQESFTVTRLIGTTKEPKSRICLDIYGGLNVKIPNYARKASEMPYLILEEELNYVIPLEKYESLRKSKLITELRDAIKSSAGEISSGQEDEAWARLSPQYRGDTPANNVTMRYAWLRPSAFNILDTDEPEYNQLRKLFPNGVKVTLVNNHFAEASNESLDDHWTIIDNPLSDYLHFEPLGVSLDSIQEITNDLISFTLQTIEQGIGQTFADPGVFNFKNYSLTEVSPGSIFPATPKSGKSLNDAFFQMKTATLSGEVLPFSQSVQQMGQLASGALPSLFGGQMQSSSGTASEYSMSRAQALQRLQNNWKMFTSWWKTTFSKIIPMYIKEVKDDERDVERLPDGSFVNVFIRRAELEGKIGKVELEANENLPITWSQQKDTVMTLLQSTVPSIQAFLSAPENLPIIKDAIGLTDFFIPGMDDREKQYEEIKLLLNSQPMENPIDLQEVAQMAYQGLPEPPEKVSSIPPEADVDNHVIQYEICRAWLISLAGRQAKVDNKEGYENILLHAKEHLILIPPPPGMPESGNGANPEKPSNPSLKNAPIQGESNVATVN